MSEIPAQYTEARANLLTLRQKIFQELIAGRVKAQLNASHETLIKYGKLVDSLSIVPYMMSNIKQKALALRLNSVDVGEGEIAQAKTDFVIEKGSYPLSMPYNVSQRELPKVDVFLYSPPTEMELVETTSEKVWSNLFLIQSEKNFYIDSADASNVFFDFYKFRPIGRYNVEITLSDPRTGFADWIKLTGEATVLVRDLVKVGQSELEFYEIYVMVDANYYSSGGEVGVVPMIMIVTADTALSEPCIIIGGGKRTASTDRGVYAGWIIEGQFNGWTKTHDTYTVDVKTVLWANLSKLTIAVNDTVMGTTTPIPNTYDKKATDELLVTAYPNTNYIVKNWELDDIQYPASDTFTVKCYRNHTLVCVFRSGVLVVMRPESNSTCYLTSQGDSPNYKCVDDVLSDGDATFVYPKLGQVGCTTDLYNLSTASLPPTAVVDYIDVFFRVRSEVEPFKAIAKSLIKTHGVTYMSDEVKPSLAWELHSTRYMVNPFSKALWTSSEIEDLQLGLLLCISGSVGLNWVRTRCTQVWVEVCYHVP